MHTDGNKLDSDLLRYAIQQEFNFSEFHLLLELILIKKTIIFEAEQINKLRFGMYTESVKKSCITSIVFKYVWFSLPM